nr:radical SAM protein [Lacrimispora algidixylanolytica]
MTHSDNDYKLWVNTENRKGKVILIHPFVEETRTKNRNYSTESLTLGCLIGSLRKAGYSCVAVNSEMNQWDAYETSKYVLKHDDIFFVGISCKSERSYGVAKTVASLIKAKLPNVHITIGGILATVSDKRILEDCKYFDSVSRGEGEFLITELAYKLLYGMTLNDIKSLTYRNVMGVIRNPLRQRIINLDKVPLSFRTEMHELKENGSTQLSSAYMFTSRGCFGNCSFCCVYQLLGNHMVYKRSPENVVNEIKEIVENYGVTEFYFIDDLFILPSKKGEIWVDKFCYLLDEANLKIKFHVEIRADTVQSELIKKLVNHGLFRIFIGAEAGCNSVLERYNKKCTVQQNNKALYELKQSGIPKYQVELGYIMFDAAMTYQELKENYYWLKESGLSTVQNLQNRMNVYYGTQMYHDLIHRFNLEPPKFGESWINNFYMDKGVEFVEGTIRRIRKELYKNNTGLLCDFFGVLDKYKKEIGFFGYTSQNEEKDEIIYNILYSIYKYLNKEEREIYYSIFESCFEYIENSSKRQEDFETLLAETVNSRATILREASTYFDNIIDAFSKTYVDIRKARNIYHVYADPHNYFEVILLDTLEDKFACNVNLKFGQIMVN